MNKEMKKMLDDYYKQRKPLKAPKGCKHCLCGRVISKDQPRCHQCQHGVR